MTETPAVASDAIRPFAAAIPDADIDDLKSRLARTRWPDRETVADWSQGVRLEHARRLIRYWEHDYDWRRLEAALNRYPQFLTRIDGLDIHFIHVASSHPNAMPLILTHGWPGSVLDFLRLIGPLTDPVAHGGRAADAFDVVIPSLPGFAWSGKPTSTGWNVERIARAWAELMRRLGYTRWAAQGGDWGSVVTTALANLRPDGLLGIHLNTPYAFPETIPENLSPEEQHAVDTLALYGGPLGGSNHLQGTRPQTPGFALADSPAGQAAWIYEKFQSKTDNRGLAEDAIDLDTILDTISLYWFTNTAASSARIYWENRAATMAGPTLTLPVAVTVFPKDIPVLPRTWIEDKYTDLIHYAEADEGGHFAALEQPDILVDEIRAGLRPLRAPRTGR
ncbi:epoxide hydrolase family protein [Nocardioides luteus]|uniref:Epoxide hydrolase n=1 Tax=Nocardioides luteus TaxID=1844 RepID=A0A1J4N6N3_9ACTN|nr:epoxide hydrolase family protein [Nocardioides luteus]OIJ27179.1 epoxide hydrolase [Nocardioides luteus]